MPTLHIGKHRVQTISSSDGLPVPPGSVTASAEVAGLVDVSVDPATNAVTITGVATANGVNVHYSASGYISATESFQVLAQPSLIVTDGPEQ